jgi:AraC family transcriptional activator FtrA
VIAVSLPDALILDLAAPAQIFGFLGGDRYTVEVVGLRPGNITAATGVTIAADRGLEGLEEADTVVIPGFATWETATFPEVAQAVARAHARGARVMSICTGALVLAEAGVLDGLRATTHWMAAELLARRRPAVHVDADVLYIDEGDVLTSAGVAAGIDLSLHVLRRDHGAAAAAEAARVTVFSPFREGGQAQFVPPSVSVSNIGTAAGSSTAPAREWALAHLDRRMTVDELAGLSAMSRRTFNRHFRADTGTTPARWILGQRLRLAQELFETTDASVEEIAGATGFANSAALRAHFQRRLDMTPTAYRRSFSATRREHMSGRS